MENLQYCEQSNSNIMEDDDGMVEIEDEMPEIREIEDSNPEFEEKALNLITFDSQNGI